MNPHPGSHHGGTDYIAWFLIAPFVIALVIVLAMSIRASASARERASAPREPVGLSVVEALAREVRGSAIVTLVIAAAGGLGSFFSEEILVVVLLASPILLVLVIAAGVRCYKATRVLNLVHATGATAEAQGDQVEVTAAGVRARLAVAAWRIVMAKRKAA